MAANVPGCLLFTRAAPPNRRRSHCHPHLGRNRQQVTRADNHYPSLMNLFLFIQCAENIVVLCRHESEGLPWALQPGMTIGLFKRRKSGTNQCVARHIAFAAALRAHT